MTKKVVAAEEPPVADSAGAAVTDEQAPLADNADAGADAALPETDPAVPAEEVPTTEVLVLCDYLEHRAGTVAVIPSSAVQAAVDYGWADPHPDAVAYGKAATPASAD